MNSGDQLSRSDSRLARSYRLLYIDDSPSVRTAFATLYELLGHQVDVAEDGPSGLQKIQQTDYDIVISDFTMPLMNGREVAGAIKAIRSDTIVVLVTGWPLSQVAPDVGEEAMEDYLFQKPFTVAQLSEVISGIKR